MGCLKLKYCSEKEVPGINLVLKKGVSGKNEGEGKSCAGAYRYGFNGQELLDEVYGLGNYC